MSTPLMFCTVQIILRHLSLQASLKLTEEIGDTRAGNRCVLLSFGSAHRLKKTGTSTQDLPLTLRPKLAPLTFASLSLTLLTSACSGDSESGDGPDSSEALPADSSGAGAPAETSSAGGDGSLPASNGAAGSSSNSAGAPNSMADTPNGGMPAALDVSTAGSTTGGASAAGAATDDNASATDSTEPLPAGEHRGWEIFSQDTVVEYHFTMSEADYNHIEEEGVDEEYRSASVHITGGDIDLSFEEVGLRHKGNWTLTHCFERGQRDYADECAKLSYKIKFNWAEPDDNSDSDDQDWRFYGLKRLGLHAMQVDDVLMAESLAYGLFNEFGVKTARTDYARVYVNDEFKGLFLAVEPIDGRWAASRFPNDKDGNLYKEAWPTGRISDPEVRSALAEGGTDFFGAEQGSIYESHLKTNNGAGDSPDVSDMLAFADAVAASDVSTFKATLSPLVDIDQLYRYMAIDRAARNWDGLTAFYDTTNMQPHNFFWYHEPAQDQWHLVPWDMDNTFWYYDPFMHPEKWVADPTDEDDEPNEGEQLPDWNEGINDCSGRSSGVTIAWGNTLAPPGCDQLLNLLASSDWPRFAEIGNELLAGPLLLPAMQAKVDMWMAKIATSVEDDPNLDFDAWQQAALEWRDITLPGVISEFETHLLEGYDER